VKITGRLISDTHGEFSRDGGVAFAQDLPAEGVDVLVAAGDIAGYLDLASVLGILADRFPAVLVVLGNHEYYGTSKAQVTETMLGITERHPNLSWLNRTTTEVAGITFAGATSWWGRHPDNPTVEEIEFLKAGITKQAVHALVSRRGISYAAAKRGLVDQARQIARRSINDFLKVEDLLSWVYRDHDEDMAFLQSQASRADVVVTHLAPSPRSVALRWVGSPINRYFLNDLEGVVEASGASFWLHGHMHTPCDYVVGTTRVLCDPRGYPREGRYHGYTGTLFEVQARGKGD